ncbi:aspartyl protease family protein [Asticcacaulis tiandongensis]|uniref:aspartyl protease family protein n=1 Tax=Asticcacaulis tiandongensis TaxID=2565365 RepID=UPI00112ED7A1|nr:aspartyl protease family protein [Asticcacaulis tiandongensis]
MLTRRQMAVLLGGAGAFPFVAQAEPRIVRVPLTLYRRGLPMVQAHLNGRGPYNFLLDTGASTSLVKHKIAVEAGLRPVGQGVIRGASGTETTELYHVSHLQVGDGLNLREWQVVGSRGFNVPDVDGLLSIEALTSVPCQIDFQAKELRYYPVAGSMDLTGFGNLEAQFHGGRARSIKRAYIRLNLAGRKINCLLDTGAEAPLSLFADYVEAQKLWDKYPLIGEGRSQGVNGKTVSNRIVEMRDIQVGGIWVPRMAVMLANPDDRNAMKGGAHAQGVVGAAFLSAFILAFDGERSVHVKSTGSLLGLAPPEKVQPNLPEAVAGRETIPFRLGEDRRFLFPVTVGGKTYSGAFALADAQSTIGSNMARVCGLKALPEGGYDASALVFGEVSVAGFRLFEAENPKQSIHLGQDFLRLLPSELNLDDKYMTRYTEGAPEKTGYSRLPVERDAKGRMILPAKLAGRDMRFVLDTLVGYGVMLTPASVRKHALWDAYPKAENRLSGAKTKIRYTGISGLEFGDFRIDPAPVTLFDPAAADDPKYEGLDGAISIGVLWRFNMIFDQDGSVWFKPNKRFGYNPGSIPAAPA